MASLELLDKNTCQACDAIESVEDGVINDPRLCPIEKLALENLKCRSKAKNDCLTEEQIEMATYRYEGLIAADGTVLSPGVMPGAESAGNWAMWMLPTDQLGGDGSLSLIDGMTPFLDILMRKVARISASKFDPVEDFYILEEISFLALANANLKDFKENGDELLMYQGWNDFPLRAVRALEFFDQANELNGGPDQTEDFFRLFMVPGVVHCGAGPGAWLANHFNTIVDWRK